MDIKELKSKIEQLENVVLNKDLERPNDNLSGDTKVSVIETSELNDLLDKVEIQVSPEGATYKQRNLIEKMEYKLGVKFGGATKKEASKFISEHMDEFKK